MIAEEIALAFNEQNDRPTWVARISNSGTYVHFVPTASIVSLIYTPETGLWEVRFNKYHSAFGDYVKAIARAMYTVLTILKAAGLPFDCPDSYAGIEVVMVATEDSTVYVRTPVEEHKPLPEPAEGL